MDDTQSSRVSEAAATRKRRSSILKSQRAPRTPFSELEFNVATPPDTTKSRRVSFSRRTGVAEFVTNEATTTWKNFYEEHNKSLESSGNESGAKAARPSINHIGKRIFDQQFEEVEAVDFESALMPGNSRAAEFNLSINNVNLTQQLAAFDCSVDDKKLTAPQQHFELSSLTDHQSKVFSDDLTIPAMGEMSSQINVNFSTMKTMGVNDKCDDLDEIQKDLERSHNLGCPGPFTEQNMSGYIEVDLNMTHVAVANDESDMSITDTVHSPKVQEVSSSISVTKTRKAVADDDWIAQKENIAVLNPYIAPREADNFAINEEPDQVLVFDGKRLTIQSEKKEIPVANDESKRDKGNYRQTLLPDAPVDDAPQRKTIVLNMDDDLPNFGDDRFLLHRHEATSGSAQELKHTMIFEEGDLSMTQAVQNILEPSNVNAISNRRKTILSENTLGNISLTQPVHSNVILDHVTREKRKTIIYDDTNANVSVTQALSANVLLDNKSVLINKRRTTIYDSENVSFTQAVPANLILQENNEKSSNKTILFSNNVEDISFTQVLPNNIQLENAQVNKTTAFEKSACNISMTQVVPSNIILCDNNATSNKRRTMIYENDDADISMTQAIPTNLILTEKSQVDECLNNKTVVIENDVDDVSITPALVSDNIVHPDTSKIQEKDSGLNKSDNKLVSHDSKEDINVTSKANPMDVSLHASKSVPNKRLTIMYDEHADISMTQALPSNILASNLLREPDERKSVCFGNETGNISFTQAIPSNILSQEKNDEDVAFKSMLHEVKDLSETQVVSNTSNLARKSMIVDSNENKSDSTINEIIQHMSPNKQALDIKDTGNSEMANVSKCKPIPSNIYDIENEVLKADMEMFANLTQFGEKTLLQDTIHDNSNVDILVYQANINDTSEIDKTLRKDLKDAESKASVGVKIMDTTAKSAKNLDSNCNDNEFVQEKDIDMQINLPYEDVKADEQNDSCKLLEDTKERKSILHELLDMSSTSLVDDNIDKNITSQVDTEMLAEKSMKSSENNSAEAMFVITEDADENIQTDNDNNDEKVPTVKVLNLEKIAEIENRQVPAIECKTENENNLEDKLCDLRRSVIEEKKNSPPQNRLYEKIVSSDLQGSFNEDTKDITDVKDVKTRKSFKEADDTKELLEILSDFTDRKSIAPAVDRDDKVPQVKLRSSMAAEYKTEITEPKRLSFAPTRQSIVLTREELLNNLSMAQATLQQSRFDIEDSEVDDTATESPTEINESVKSPAKSVRMSNEVVKTLHFEDESCSDLSLKSDVKVTPLKKTAFGETSYMKESKANVIPTYLKDVSDNIKALMNDLVKPRPDQMPFEVISQPKAQKNSSTCSTQIQANLITSSQIDLDVELHSNVNSVYDFNKGESIGTDDDMGNKVNRPLKGRLSDVIDDSNNGVGNRSRAKYSDGHSNLKTHQEPVLVFDHHNPLNNVLLAPPNCVDTHRYNPVTSSDDLLPKDNATNGDQPQKGNCEVERLLTQYHVESRVGLQSGDACPDKKGDSHSLFSDPSKPLSMDRSTEGITMEVKTTEVNTVIAMKGNKELLEASSSLTLVDDAITQNVFDIEVEARSKDQNSPVKVIYKIDDEDVSMLENVDSDLVSNEDEPMEYHNARKRSYSPSHRDVTRPSTLSSPDVTPKPVSKMQKISTSPNVQISATDNMRDSEKSDMDSNSDNTEPIVKRSSRKSKCSPKHNKPGADVTVQHLITEYKITKMEQDLIEDQIIEALHDRMSFDRKALDGTKCQGSPDGVSSCTSSKDQSEMHVACVKETVSYVGSQPSRVEWKPDLKEPSASNILTDCDSSVNVVAKIDMLPFMGKECEWETSGGDTWVFRLLRARLRLRVRLAHRHHNALRTRVRADTPVAELCVDAVPVEEKDPLAALCVRFAAEAMRYECGRGCARAAAVPPLLRRCAGVARVALRWARAMRDARARLAYTLSEDGSLALKVANIPLRSVWEVRMRLELVVEDAREAAWPRAGDVRVRAVLADCAVGGGEVARALQPLQHDWGHAPRALWKIFRYLKNKTRDDTFLRL